MSVKYGNETQEEFNKRNIKRWYFLKSKNWREIRIISRKDYLPSDKIIIEMILYGIKYLNAGHNWIHFDIDNQLVKCSQFEKIFNYGN